MTRPGPAHPPGGATLHRSSPARLALAAGLLALGIGDLAVINIGAPAALLRRGRGNAGGRGLGRRVVPAAEPPAAPVAVTPPPPPPVARVPATEPAERRASCVPERRRVRPPPGSPPRRRARSQPAAAAAGEPGRAGEFPDLLFALNTNWLSRASRETLDKVVAALEADAESPGHPERAHGRGRAARAEPRAWPATAPGGPAAICKPAASIPRGSKFGAFGSERPAPDAPPGAMRARNRRVEIAIE